MQQNAKLKQSKKSASLIFKYKAKKDVTTQGKNQRKGKNTFQMNAMQT